MAYERMAYEKPRPSAWRSYLSDFIAFLNAGTTVL